jgi:GNAT superfamily N-acetyltransferase
MDALYKYNPASCYDNHIEMNEREYIMNIRRATADDYSGIARVHVDNWLNTYKEIFPAEVLNTWTYETREVRWKKSLPKALSGGTMTFVAEERGTILAFALAGTMRDARLRMRYTGEIYGVFVHPEHQGRGLGRKLFEACAEHLLSFDHARAALWTLENNPDRDFFEIVGGKKVYDAPDEIGGRSYTKVAYGWDDLEKFQKHKLKLN